MFADRRRGGSDPISRATMEGWTSCVDNADATRSVRCARFSTYDAPAVAAEWPPPRLVRLREDDPPRRVVPAHHALARRLFEVKRPVPGGEQKLLLRSRLARRPLAPMREQEAVVRLLLHLLVRIHLEGVLVAELLRLVEEIGLHLVHMPRAFSTAWPSGTNSLCRVSRRTITH